MLLVTVTPHLLVRCAMHQLRAFIQSRALCQGLVAHHSREVRAPFLTILSALTIEHRCWVRGVQSCSHKRRVLGIESSCDDTAAAVVTEAGEILGEALATQEEVHRQWGGVVPSLAQEAHQHAIDNVVEKAMQTAGMKFTDLDAVAYTVGPGLSLCLQVGARKARKVAFEHNLPLVPCHHMEAHALVARLGNEVEFPFLCALVSGGHNLILIVRGVGDYMQVCCHHWPRWPEGLKKWDTTASHTAREYR
jgi:hypothetical protein